jgi:hypothetical protein
MTTVIDALVVQLELDAEPYKRSWKDVDNIDDASAAKRDKVNKRNDREEKERARQEKQNVLDRKKRTDDLTGSVVTLGKSLAAAVLGRNAGHRRQHKQYEHGEHEQHDNGIGPDHDQSAGRGRPYGYRESDGQRALAENRRGTSQHGARVMSDDSAPSDHSAGPVVRSTLVRSHCAKCREETLHKGGRCIHCATETRQPEAARTSVGDALIEASFNGTPRVKAVMSPSAKRNAAARTRRWRAKKRAERLPEHAPSESVV